MDGHRGRLAAVLPREPMPTPTSIPKHVRPQFKALPPGADKGGVVPARVPASVRRPIASRTKAAHTDAELVTAAADGEQAAFGELYRRHVDRAHSAARGVASNSHDAADAVSDAFANVFRVVRAGRFPEGAEFRAYIVTAARRLAIDQRRRGARMVPGDDMDRSEMQSLVTRPSERVVSVENAALVVRAFMGLTARQRAVLYLTDVECLPMQEAAALLGVTPNTCAQRAVRARARLRERYLQAHVAPSAEPNCRDTAEKLGAYVGTGLSSRDVRDVEAHLGSCETCRYRVVELRDIGVVLRRGRVSRVATAAG